MLNTFYEMNISYLSGFILFFNIVCILQPNGVQKNLGLGKLSDYENQLLKAAIPELKKNIQKGEDFVNKK